MKQHYKALGLEEGASQQEIEAAFKRLSKVLDPANNDNQEFFIEEYKKVQEAYNALYNTSILGTEKGVNSFKKTQPKSNDKEPSIPESTVKSKANKIPLKENKLPKKGYSIIKWFLVLLGSIISGGLFAFIVGVYYFQDEALESFIENAFYFKPSSPSYVISDIHSNFLIGFLLFIVLFVSIKNPPQFNFKKSLVQWFFIFLGCVLSGGLFSLLISVYYFNELTIKGFIQYLLNLKELSSRTEQNIISNFVIGLFIFLFLLIFINKPTWNLNALSGFPPPLNLKKSKTKKIKFPKKRISKRDVLFGILLFSIAIGIWILILQNMNFFV